MIEEHKFGSFVINGREYLGDIKIIDGKVKPWENRIKHNVNLADIRELLDINPEVLVIGTGNSGLLNVPSEIIDLITAKRIYSIIDLNTKAIKKYNEALLQKNKVVALFHATC